MSSAEELMQRLAVSKKIMEKTEKIKNLDAINTNSQRVRQFEPVSTKYNIPNELMVDQERHITLHNPTKPLEENKILNSKLPDEIKRLMIEQPIVQPDSISSSVNISDDVIQGAQRLMNINKPIQKQKINEVSEDISSSKDNINISEIKNIIRDTVRDTVRDVIREELKEYGMIVESTTNTNEILQFKVGNHIFVGKVTKVKKLQK